MSDLQDLYKYYRFLDPKIDLSTGEVNISTATGESGQQAQGRNSSSTAGLIFNCYISNATSGKELTTGQLHETLLEQSSPSSNKNVKGLFFNTVYQQAKQNAAKFLDDKYWRMPQHAASVNGKDSEKPSVADTPINFYSQVCGMEGEPPVDFSINVLRSPFLTKSRRNVDEIQTFLNYIPSTFASRMVPYLDVEFQLPVTNDEKGNAETKFLNKPSLLRFLLGSIEVPKTLTTADKSLIKTIITPSKESAFSQSSFVGMEMFTSPQTLTNMDSLGVDSGRINQAKPFLPPATLLGGSVQVRNAGAGMFTHKTANIDFKVHDKNRLVEFAEFVRGPAGYSNVTVWLTYGWLAPRSNSDEDIYAKFINHNMLVREAYMVKNAGFSFDTTGQVTVKVELVSKMMGPVQTYSLDAGDANLKEIRRYLEELGEKVKLINQGVSVFGEPPEGMKDIRFYQVLGAAGSGELNLDIPYADLKKIIEATKNNLNKKTKKGTPVFSKSEKEQAGITLDKILELYSPDVIKKIKDNSRRYIDGRLATCLRGDKSDPFLPIAGKNEYHSEDLANQCKKTIPYDAQIKEKDPTKLSKLPIEPSKSAVAVVSLGRLFSIFCLPSLLSNASSQKIDEVQINFYQFNESCGPLSYANIAEFPIDFRFFYLQFQDFIEQRGGESMTVQDFMQFVITTQVMDNRALGYGMKDFYQPLSRDNISDLQQVKDFDTKIAAWIAEYKSLKQPNIVMYAETIQMTDSNVTKNLDLLQKISSTVGSYYNEPNFNTEGNIKKMLRIHIYDKSFDPYAIVAQTIIKNDAGGFTVISDAELKKTFEDIGNPAAAAASNPAIVERIFNEFAKLAQQGKARIIPGSTSVNRDVLRNFVGELVPTITYGTNGSMITNATLASKTDGLLGTINLLGGSQKSSAKLSDNGLAHEANNLPMRIVPAQLTMTSLGCPIAEPYQSFYIDFGTGTTLDNIYASTQVAHTFSPGKFETSWTFAYADGYGKFFSASSLGDAMKKFNEDIEKSTR